MIEGTTQFEFVIRGRTKNTSKMQAEQDLLDLLGRDFERYVLLEVFTEKIEVTEIKQ